MMSETTRSWSIRGIVLLSIALLTAWIANNTYWDEIEIATPLRGEAATDPQYAVKKFLEALGARVESERSLNTVPPTNAAIVMNNWHWDLIDSRRERLEEWVRAGGRLIVDPSVIGVFTGFANFSEVRKQVPKRIPKKEAADEEDAEDEAEAEDDEEVGFDVAIQGEEVKCNRWDVSIDARGASGKREYYSLCRLIPIGSLVSRVKPVWAVRNEEGYQAVRVAVGKGSVTVLNASPFDNRRFRDVDRGALLVALTQLQRNDEVWLLTEADHPSLLTLIWRYGAPVAVVFGLFIAAVLWRNAIRFGPLTATPEIARRSLAEQIRGTGWFSLRLGGDRALHAAMVRALREAATRRISNYERLVPEQQLAALERHTGIDRDSLQEALYATTASTRRKLHRHSLYRAIGTLETARRALLSNTSARATHSNTSDTSEASHAN